MAASFWSHVAYEAIFREVYSATPLVWKDGAAHSPAEAVAIIAAIFLAVVIIWIQICRAADVVDLAGSWTSIQQPVFLRLPTESCDPLDILEDLEIESALLDQKHPNSRAVSTAIVTCLLYDGFPRPTR
jgi:hypothetical protein